MYNGKRVAPNNAVPSKDACSRAGRTSAFGRFLASRQHGGAIKECAERSQNKGCGYASAYFSEEHNHGETLLSQSGLLDRADFHNNAQNQRTTHLRICLLTSANAFVYDNSPSKQLPPQKQQGNMRLRPTGGLTLTYALARYLCKHYGEGALPGRPHRVGATQIDGDSCHIVAVDFVEQFQSLPPRIETWEGHSVIRAPLMSMPSFIHTLDLQWDIVVVAFPTLDLIDFANTHIRAPRRAVMCHDYAGMPFGPFSNVDVTERQALLVALKGWRVLCDSEHLTRYVSRWALHSKADVEADCCYGATYDYFTGDTSDFPPVYQPWAWEEPGFCTMISPCPAKGLSLLLRIATLLPHVRFAVVATSWTNDIVLTILRKALANVTILDASPNVDDFYQRTRVLLAPSIWPEAFGLVVTEAELRGIPAICTTNGGLVEAQMEPALALPVTIFYDGELNRLVHGTTMNEMEDEIAARAPPPMDVDATACKTWHEKVAVMRAKGLVDSLSDIAEVDEAMPMAKLIGRLMTEDKFLKDTSTRVHAEAMAFVNRHRGSMAALLERAVQNQRETSFSIEKHVQYFEIGNR